MSILSTASAWTLTGILALAALAWLLAAVFASAITVWALHRLSNLRDQLDAAEFERDLYRDLLADYIDTTPRDQS
ncbi:hypothetical protein [Actinoplanes sp. NPDC051851]|uniref:hypothetical protein n=1 Tax=Actinoplanes sp. NPDC051851 TaxID=3154753 RepID=UPI0034377EE6